MLKQPVEAALNAQIEKEGYSSQLYLAMASWAETNGFYGTAGFLFAQAEEERMHMLKLFHYINDRGGCAKVTALKEPPQSYESINSLFKQVLDHELFITDSINELVGVCMDNRDFTTNNFLQWFVNEQIEEESNVRAILDRLNMLGDDKARMYLFEKDIANIRAELAQKAAPKQTAG